MLDPSECQQLLDLSLQHDPLPLGLGDIVITTGRDYFLFVIVPRVRRKAQNGDVPLRSGERPDAPDDFPALQARQLHSEHEEIRGLPHDQTDGCLARGCLQDLARHQFL